jgi:hypothetical protein
MNFFGIPKQKARGGFPIGFKFKEDVGYSGLHDRIRHKLVRPCLCACTNRPPVDLHNIDGNYTEDLSTWTWLCRSCHSKIHRPVGYKNMNIKGKKSYKKLTVKK